ncbi:MAG: hypothetical protein ACR2MY_02895 [Candidatus Dormibacteria bacterium]
MDARRAPQGLQAEDRIALGLSAPHLFYLVIFSLTGWAIISSRLPGVIAFPCGLTLIATGVALAWGGFGGRPLDRWAWLYLAYRARPRGGTPATAASAVSAARAEPEKDLDAAPLEERIIVLPVGTRRISHQGVNLHQAQLHDTQLHAAQLHAAQLHHTHRTRRCAFLSYRGGTGTSTLATETAVLIARSTQGGAVRPTSVALLDLDLKSSSMGIRLGLQGADLGDILRAPDLDVATIERVLLRHESGARCLLAPTGGLATADPYQGLIPRLAIVLAYLDQHFDVVLLDLKGRGDDLEGYVLEAVDDIYYVFTPTAPGIFDLYRGVAALRRAGHRDKLRLVLNHADRSVDLSEVVSDLRLAPVAEIPTLTAIGEAESRHRPASLSDDSSGEALRDVVLSVWPDSVFDSGSPWTEEAVAATQRAPLRR